MKYNKKIDFQKTINIGVQFFKFGIVGISNTLLTLSIIFILMKFFFVSYKISNVIGYAFGFINSFIWNKFWTFKSKNFQSKEIVLFILVFLISYAIQFLLLLFLKEIINVKVELSQIFAMIFYTIINFFGNKYLTFKKKEKECQV